MNVAEEDCVADFHVQRKAREVCVRFIAERGIRNASSLCVG